MVAVLIILNVARVNRVNFNNEHLFQIILFVIGIFGTFTMIMEECFTMRNIYYWSRLLHIVHICVFWPLTSINYWWNISMSCVSWPQIHCPWNIFVCNQTPVHFKRNMCVHLLVSIHLFMEYLCVFWPHVHY